MSKLKFEIVHFLVILVLLLLNVGGCGGQPLSSKFILKVKKQNPLPKEHVHITFLTPWIVFVGILGFQSRSKHYEKPCILPGCRLRPIWKTVFCWFHLIGAVVLAERRRSFEIAQVALSPPKQFRPKWPRRHCHLHRPH